MEYRRRGYLAAITKRENLLTEISEARRNLVAELVALDMAEAEVVREIEQLRERMTDVIEMDQSGELDRSSAASERAMKAWETRRANGWVHPKRRERP